MCFICDRINMIKDGTNPYFVKELETGYAVIGDHQHFKGYTLFLCKQHKNIDKHSDAPENKQHIFRTCAVYLAVRAPVCRDNIRN